MEDSESQVTVRQQLMDLLCAEEMTVRELSQALRIAEKEVLDHLTHIERTALRQKKQLLVKPFECLSCGFVFDKRSRLSKPGRCPRCKKSHIQNAKYQIK